MSDMTTYIYVIGRAEGPVKVGITADLFGRIRSLQTGCPFKLRLLYASPATDRANALEHEQIFRDVYAEQRLEGEWFDMSADEAIEGVQTGFQHEQWFIHKRIFERPKVLHG